MSIQALTANCSEFYLKKQTNKQRKSQQIFKEV